MSVKVEKTENKSKDSVEITVCYGREIYEKEK